VRKGRSADGLPEKHVRIIQKLIPIRDAVREVLKCQKLDRPWKDAQVRLRIAWSNFVRGFGPINTTVVSTTGDPETGEVRGAVVLNERGHADPHHIAELVHRDGDDVIAELGSAIFERTSGPQRRRHRGGEGEALEDQDGVPELDLVRS
jgi:N12 class adenine-specific DNA methylase